MPGIFGFVLKDGARDGEQIARELAAGMQLFPWQTTTVADSAAGRVFLGAAANGPHDEALTPYVHREQGLVCVLDGVITRVCQDCAAGPLVADGRYAAGAAAMYRTAGEDFADNLEGQYSVILHDDAVGRLIVANDRNGLVPLYQYADPHGVLFCSLLGPLAACGFLAPSLDPAAVSTMLGHHHLFYRQSLVAGVSLYDPATVTTVAVAVTGISGTMVDAIRPPRLRSASTRCAIPSSPPASV